MKTILIVCDTFGNVHRFDGCGIRAINCNSSWEVLSEDENIATFFGISWYKFEFDAYQGMPYAVQILSSPLAQPAAKPLWMVTLPIVAVIALGIAAGLYKIYGG